MRDSTPLSSSFPPAWTVPSGLPSLPDRDDRPRRAMLLTPGHRFERLTKAVTLDVDAVAFDLEDGVPAARKAEARASVRRALTTLETGHRERVVRINAMGTPEFDDDLKALPWGWFDTLLIPKVESADEVRALERRVTELEKLAWHHGDPTGPSASPSPQPPLPVRFILTLETPRGVLRALDIADASSRSVALFFGSGDYTLRTGGSLSVASLATPRGLIVAAAAAAGLQALDAPFLEGLQDIAGTFADAQRAHDVGFSGKVVFHPDQVDPVNRAFTPTDEEAHQARRAIEAFHNAQAQGESLALVDGRFIAMDLIPQLVKRLRLYEHAHGVWETNPALFFTSRGSS